MDKNGISKPDAGAQPTWESKEAPGASIVYTTLAWREGRGQVTQGLSEGQNEDLVFDPRAKEEDYGV
jgi:hypothetical protein